MSLNSNPIARITKATRALFAPFITPHKRQTIKKTETEQGKGREKNKNITFHIWFFGGIFPSLARSVAQYCNCEWDSYVGPQPIPPPPLLLPVTVTTHTCKSHQFRWDPFSALVRIGSAIYNKSRPFIKATHQFSSIPCALLTYAVAA